MSGRVVLGVLRRRADEGACGGYVLVHVAAEDERAAAARLCQRRLRSFVTVRCRRRNRWRLHWRGSTV